MKRWAKTSERPAGVRPRAKALARRAGLEVRRYRPPRRYVGPSPEFRRARILQTFGIGLILDVGANAGQYALEAREHGYGADIVSFEPVAAAFAALSSATATDPRWTCWPLALGATDGRVAMNVAANEGRSSSVLAQREVSFGTLNLMRYVGQEEVEMATLDRLGPQVVTPGMATLLKLDVQGLELDVLRGGQRLLPSLALVESELSLLPIYEGQPPWREIVDFLDEQGFELFAVEPGYSDSSTGRVVEIDAIFRNRCPCPA